MGASFTARRTTARVMPVATATLALPVAPPCGHAAAERFRSAEYRDAIETNDTTASGATGPPRVRVLRERDGRHCS